MQDLASLLQLAALYSSRQRAGVPYSYGTFSRPAPQGHIPRVTQNKTADVTPRTDSAEVSGANASPDANKTYYFQRKSRLDYMMNLRFNLGAFTQAAEKASEGDTKALEELVSAGFGLSADLKFKGHQEVSTNMSDEQAAMNLHSREESRSSATARMAALVASGDRAYALSAFYKEAESVRRNMNVSEHNGHRQAVSSFAARFTLDSRFSFAFMQRFNVQTADVAKTAPDQVGNYLSTATGLAGQASPQLMGTFFDAVDTYLGDAEKQITAKAEEFFTMAAAEMGLSGEMVDAAKSQLMDKIEGFFNRVETALDVVESRYIPAQIETQPATAPSPLPASTTASLSNQIATA